MLPLVTCSYPVHYPTRERPGKKARPVKAGRLNLHYHNLKGSSLQIPFVLGAKGDVVNWYWLNEVESRVCFKLSVKINQVLNSILHLVEESCYKSFYHKMQCWVQSSVYETFMGTVLISYVV